VEAALRDAKLDLKDLNEVILVGGSTRIPSVIELVTKIAGKEPNVSVNPDEVVALGAAVQAGVLAGEVRHLLSSNMSIRLVHAGVIGVASAAREAQQAADAALCLPGCRTLCSCCGCTRQCCQLQRRSSSGHSTGVDSLQRH